MESTILVGQINLSQYCEPIKASEMIGNESNRDSFRINLLTVPTTILKKIGLSFKSYNPINKNLNKQKDP